MRVFQRQGRSRVPRAIDGGTPVEYTVCVCVCVCDKTNVRTARTSIKTTIKTTTMIRVYEVRGVKMRKVGSPYTTNSPSAFR